MASLREMFGTSFLPPSVLMYCRSAADWLGPFVPPTPEKSLLRAYWKHSYERIRKRFDGGTSEEEEDFALNILLSMKSAEGLIFLINTLTWDTLDDELDESDLDNIAERLSWLLDRRDHDSVGSIMRKLFRDPNALKDSTPGDVATQFTSEFSARTVASRQAVVDELLTNRDRLLNDTSILALRKTATNAPEFKWIVQNIPAIENHRAAEVTQLDWEVFYTDLICYHLERGETRPILLRLPDLVNAQLPNIQRNAFFLMLKRWDSEFRALEELIKLAGTPSQKVYMTRFMEARKVFMDNFPQVAPPLSLLQWIAQQLGLNTVVNGIEDLIVGVEIAGEAIGGLSAFDVLGNQDDAAARSCVNGLATGNLIAVLPYVYKHMLISKMLGGFTESDDEQAILTIFKTSKERSLAEFLQLVRGATWDQLDFSLDWQENDDLYKLFNF